MIQNVVRSFANYHFKVWGIKPGESWFVVTSKTVNLRDQGSFIQLARVSLMVANITCPK